MPEDKRAAMRMELAMKGYLRLVMLVSRFLMKVILVSVILSTKTNHTRGKPRRSWLEQ